MAAFELYEASGCSPDWSRQVAKINHTYTIELRPVKALNALSGFDFPEADAYNAGVEMYDGFVAYLNTFTTDFQDSDILAICKNKMDAMLDDIDDSSDYLIDSAYLNKN